MQDIINRKMELDESLSSSRWDREDVSLAVYDTLVRSKGGLPLWLSEDACLKL
jgi:hypothetical protein